MNTDKKYEFSNWNEVLDMEVQNLHETLSNLKDVANIEDFIPSYNALLDQIDADTEGYTEWEEVGETFKYSQSDWMCEIDTRIRPIMEEWFESFCEKAEKSEIDYSEYIANFWN